MHIRIQRTLFRRPQFANTTLIKSYFVDFSSPAHKISGRKRFYLLFDSDGSKNSSKLIALAPFLGKLLERHGQRFEETIHFFRLVLVEFAIIASIQLIKVIKVQGLIY